MQGYLKLIIRVEEEDRLLTDMIKNLCNDYVSEYAQAWNEERTKIAVYAAKEILFPHCVRWLKDKLKSAAADWVASRCQLALEKVFFHVELFNI